MSRHGLERLEHSCIQPGLWLIEGHQARRYPTVRKTQINPAGIQWVVIQLKGGSMIGDNPLHSFQAAVDLIADHVDKGCDCP